MKTKRLIILLLALALLPLSSVSVMATIVDLEVGYVDPKDGDDDQQRSQGLVPEVNIEDNTLTFYTPCDGCVLRLLDENDNVVYSTVIPTGTTSIVLPSYLSGNYEIQIVQGNIYFYGNIYV